MYPAPSSPTWSLQEYVRRVQRRLQARTASRGIGLTIGVALALTVLCVAIANEFAFSDSSVIGGRMILFGSIIAVIVLALWRPLRNLGIKKAVGHAEQEVPAFDGRIETFIDQSREAGAGAPANPMLDLLAEDTLMVAETAPVEHVVGWQRMVAFMTLAGASFFALIWLGTSGPGYWGYGTSRLWGGWLETQETLFYELRVQPGDATVRLGADLTMSAEVVGFREPVSAGVCQIRRQRRVGTSADASSVGGRRLRVSLSRACAIPSATTFPRAASAVRNSTSMSWRCLLCADSSSPTTTRNGRA